MARRRATGVELPSYRPPAATDAVLDRVAFPIQAVENGGAILARSPDVPLDQRWFIEHASCYSNSTTPTTLRLYAGATTLPNLLDGSSSGNADFGDWNPGLLVPGGAALIAYWAGASTGSQGLLNVQVMILTRGAR